MGRLAETVSAQNLALARVCGVFVFRSHRQTHRMNFRCRGGRWLPLTHYPVDKVDRVDRLPRPGKEKPSAMAGLR